MTCTRDRENIENFLRLQISRHPYHLSSTCDITRSCFLMHYLTNTSSRSLRRAAAKATKPSLARGAHKEIKFSNECRASILKGVDVLSKAVSVTLGPKGKYSLFSLLITCSDPLF